MPVVVCFAVVVGCWGLVLRGVSARLLNCLSCLVFGRCVGSGFCSCSSLLLSSPLLLCSGPFLRSCPLSFLPGPLFFAIVLSCSSCSGPLVLLLVVVVPVVVRARCFSQIFANFCNFMQFFLHKSKIRRTFASYKGGGVAPIDNPKARQ